MKTSLLVLVSIGIGLVLLWTLGQFGVVVAGLSFVAGFGIRHAISKVSW